jgi:TetR/AcrR family transcriptional repressor of nem operon
VSRAEQKAETREAILDSAMKLLRARGIGASSVQDVMKGAGLTVGGFYGHFDSKEALFASTIRERAARAWSALLGSAKSVEEVTRRYLSRAHRDQPESGCLLPATASDAARPDGEPYREVLGEKVERFVQSLVAMGLSRREALKHIALMHGAISLARALKGTSLSDELLTAARK